MNEFVYGTIGGMTGVCLSHPFDTIKTRLQSNHASSISHAIRQGKLYTGLPIPLVGVMFEKSIVFGCYDWAHRHGFHPFASGIIAGAMSTLVVTPIERIKIALQTKSPLPRHPIHLMKGFVPTLCRETPGFGIYFTTYKTLAPYNPHHSSYLHFLFGCVSGAAAWLFIYPSDFIKTRMQSSHSTLSDVMTSIWRKDNPYGSLPIGIQNFYRGFSLALLRAIPLHGGVFLGYEYAKKLNDSVKMK